MYKYIVLVLLLAGCTKYPGVPDPVACNCRVATMEDTINHFKIEFTYNAKGKLVGRRVTPNVPEMPDLIIIYDQLGRVSQYIGNGSTVVGGLFEQWHYLYYDNRNNIIRDSAYYDGVIGPDGPVNEGPIEYSRHTIKYEYDAQNRMTKRWIVENGQTSEYHYNADGNLTISEYGDSIYYDHKVNFNRTDPFLQFLHRDYSLNNQVGANAYNQYGLPLAYPYIGKLHFYLYPYIFPVMQFTYNCKP